MREWLRSLPVDARRRMGEDIKTMQLGWPLGMPLVRKMEPGLWEIRSHLSDGIARVLFTVIDADMVLRTPREDLRSAQQRRNEVQA